MGAVEFPRASIVVAALEAQGFRHADAVAVLRHGLTAPPVRDHPVATRWRQLLRIAGRVRSEDPAGDPWMDDDAHLQQVVDDYYRGEQWL